MTVTPRPSSEAQVIDPHAPLCETCPYFETESGAWFGKRTVFLNRRLGDVNILHVPRALRRNGCRADLLRSAWCESFCLPLACLVKFTAFNLGESV
jgi:hypothetical protein